MRRAYILACCIIAAELVVALCDEYSCWCDSRTIDCSYRNRSDTFFSDPCFPENQYYGTRLILRGNNLREIPTNFWDNLRELDLSNTGLRQVNITWSENLQFLDVSNNYLNFITLPSSTCMLATLNISNNNFNELQSNFCQYLRLLRSANNKITHLASGILSSWPRLEYLDLSGNPIVSVSPSTFKGLSVLKTLMMGNTKLATLPEDIFSETRELRYLHLAGNTFPSLEAGVFRETFRLEILELQRNGLLHLPDRIFEHLVSLRVLFLDDNELQRLSPILFSHLHSLEDLSVRGNRLTTLPILRLCSGPLKTAMFNDNQIVEVSEAAVRSLLRYGFRLGDLRGNNLLREALQWTSNASDIVISSKTMYGFEISTLTFSVKSHGMIIF